jgi:hypothetical protein
MNARQRSLSGLLLAVVLAPILAGLLACLPVPIGDPERSRIDPDMTGIWVGFDRGVTLFEPYDKRTWLVTSVEIDAPAGCMPRGTEDDYDRLVAWLGQEQCASAGEAAIFKAWRSKHGGHWFLTMEPVAMVEDDSDKPFTQDFWFVYRIDKTSTDAFKLLMIDPEFAGFDGLPETRRGYEKVIRKHASDDELYISDRPVFERVKKEHVSLFTTFVEEHINID